MKTNCILSILLYLVLPVTVYSQMQMGIAHDNFNVTEGIRINPALAVDPIPWIDINVAGLYLFGASNGAYLPADEFSPFAFKIPEQLGYDPSVSKVNGQLEFFVLGPAINGSFGKYSVGVSTAFKNYASGRKIPTELAQGLIEGLQIPEYYNQPLSGDNYRMKSISMLEFAVNGGAIIHQKGSTVISAGANLKYLLGIAGVDFLMDNFEYEMYNDSVAHINNFTGSYGGSAPGFHPGVGYGVDLGFTLQKKVAPARYYKPHHKQSNCKYLDYVYRFGFSVLDIGVVNFKGSYYTEVDSANGSWPEYASATNRDFESVFNNLNEILVNGITESGSKYKAKLPLSFSFQFDYNFGRGVFLNSTLVYGVPLKNSFGGERISLLAITPRYEGKRFGISAPLSINSIWKPGLGLGLRFWYLTIGTDNIIPFIIDTDVYRFDVYAHAKIPIFTSRACKRRGMGEVEWHFSDCKAPQNYIPRTKGRKRR